MRIKEVIVVEGRDDESALKAAVEAEIIITHGFGIKEETFRLIEFAQKRKGVIVFTDPDFAGETIRKRIKARVKGCKHAYLSRKDATKDSDIGVENATPEAIIEALGKAKCEEEVLVERYTKEDLVDLDLIGSSDSKERREQLGKILGIGYGNGKQLLNKLNAYGITREQFYQAIKKLDKE